MDSLSPIAYHSSLGMAVGLHSGHSRPMSVGGPFRAESDGSGVAAPPSIRRLPDSRRDIPNA